MTTTVVFQEMTRCRSYREIGTVANKLMRDSGNDLSTKEEAYELMISLLLSRLKHRQ